MGSAIYAIHTPINLKKIKFTRSINTYKQGFKKDEEKKRMKIK
jgi:hypothetical protein